jgi:hypothetical protein
MRTALARHAAADASGERLPAGLMAALRGLRTVAGRDETDALAVT